MIPASVSDHRALAKRRLPRILFDYIDGGSYAEVTLRRNTEDFEALALRLTGCPDIRELDRSALAVQSC